MEEAKRLTEKEVVKIKDRIVAGTQRYCVEEDNSGVSKYLGYSFQYGFYLITVKNGKRVGLENITEEIAVCLIQAS